MTKCYDAPVRTTRRVDVDVNGREVVTLGFSPTRLIDTSPVQQTCNAARKDPAHTHTHTTPAMCYALDSYDSRSDIHAALNQCECSWVRQASCQAGRIVCKWTNRSVQPHEETLAHPGCTQPKPTTDAPWHKCTQRQSIVTPLRTPQEETKLDPPSFRLLEAPGWGNKRKSSS